MDELANALTHVIGLLLALVAVPILMLAATRDEPKKATPAVPSASTMRCGTCSCSPAAPAIT